MVLTLICVVAGLLIGLSCRPFAQDWPERYFMYIEFPGELYLRFLRLMIIPLLVSNVLLSFGTIQGKISSKLGKVSGILYLMSNLIAITVAILCAIVIQPGGARKSLQGGPSPAFHYGASGSPGLSAASPSLNGGEQAGDLLRQHQDSISRYRNYHPMYYHTNRNEDTPSMIETSNLVLENRHNLSKTVEQKEYKAELSRGILSIGGEKVDDKQVLIEIENIENLNKETNSQSGRVTIKDGEHELKIDDEASFLMEPVKKETQLMREINRFGMSTKLPIDVVLDVLRNLIPDSIIGATLRQTRTRLFTPKEIIIHKNGSTDPPPNRWPMGHEMVDQPNVIGLLAMSVLSGVVLSHMGGASKPLLDLCSCVSEMSLRIGMKAIHLAPFCIMFLLIGQLARARDLGLIAGELVMYSSTVIIALMIHGFVILPLAYYLLTKRSPIDFLKGMLDALVTSFATSSSSSTMPLMLNCLTNLNLNMIIVRAFGPLGSVFNMNGTAIYEAVAVIFIAQTLGVKLPTTSLLLVGLCSAVASLSTSGIPSSGLMTMVIVLNAVNLPVLEISLVYIVDFFIDRIRTVVNVWSGAIICGLIDHICPEELFEEEMKSDNYREMVKYRASRGSLGSRKSLHLVEEKPQVISVTITPPIESSQV